MSELIATSGTRAIVGTGATGLSVARFLAARGERFVLLDTRTNPPNLAQIQREFSDVPLELGELRQDTLQLADEIVLSPGVPKNTPAIVAAEQTGVPVIGDIELFARHARAPLVAITGTNAKSTVTTLVGEMAAAAGLRVAVGGNLGTPALELLDDAVELYVLELSSFQLETVGRLNARVAAILNVSGDHLDRYDSIREYHAAKQRIYLGAQQMVINRQDLLTHPPLAVDSKPISFGGPAEFGNFGILHEGERTWLAYQFEPLLPVEELKMSGAHNLDNALAALAIGHAAGLPMAAMLQVLREFSGLPHRCQKVTEIDGVEFFDDSKGTNVGATLAAIRGLAREPAKLVLIAGGQGKGGDFSRLAGVAEKHLRAAVLIGEDAPLLEKVLKPVVTTRRADTMDDAVAQARQLALPGDAVLLSPACASFDMFSGYRQRGEAFVAAVRGLSS